MTAPFLKFLASVTRYDATKQQSLLRAPDRPLTFLRTSATRSTGSAPEVGMLFEFMDKDGERLVFSLPVHTAKELRDQLSQRIAFLEGGQS